MGIRKVFNSFSIRARIIFIFIILITITLSVVGTIIFSNWINSAHDITIESSIRMNEETTQSVSEFLSQPRNLNLLYENLIANEYIDMTNQEERESFFVLSLQNYHQQVYSFSFGTVNGQYYGARRNEENTIEIMRNDDSTGGYSWYYSIDENLLADERVLITGLFDPRTRPWYIEATNAGETVFSPIYQHFVMEDLAISLATPIYDQQGALLGVLGTHMVLSNINTFLENILFDRDGTGIIIDLNSGELIANSFGMENYTILEDNSVHRYTIDELTDSSFEEAYKYYLETQQDYFNLKNNNVDLYYSISEVHELGVDWLIITSIPQGLLFTNISYNIFWMAVIFILSVLLMILIYQVVINRVFKPIDELVDVSNYYAQGDFSKRAIISGKDEFSRLAIAFNSMAGHITQMVENLEKTVTERTENLEIANQTLKESEKRFKILHNASFGGIAVHDQGYILECNQGLSDITGYSIEELIGMNGLLLIAPDYRDFVMDKISIGYEKPYEAFGIKKNNDIYPLRLEARNIPYEGKQVRVVEFRDLEDIKQKEKDKKESEEKFQLLFETMAQGVVYQDVEGYITSCNPKAEEILGLSLDQMQGKTSMDPRWKMIDEDGNSISGENHPAMIALRTRRKVGPVIRGVYRPESDDYVWLIINAIPIFLEGEEKPNQVYATFEDITEKKMLDNKNIYLKNLLEYIIQNSNRGIAVHDKDLNYVYVSNAYCEMYKVSKDIIGKHHYDVFPDLPSKWRDVHQRVLKGEIISGDRDPFPRADGTIDYTQWVCLPWYDDQNEIAGIIVYTEIINDLIETEMKLKDSRDYLQHIMDRLPIGIAVNSVDPEVNFEYMNDNFPLFYNTTREALEQNDSFWDVVYEDKSFREYIKTKVIEGIKSKERSKMQWEDVPITKDGSIVRYISAYAIPIPNSYKIISTVIDVTERKMKENEIVYTSNHDYLTNLPNRRYFEEMLKKMSSKEFYPLAIIMLDLDGLKLINDAFGHDQGNNALVKVAEILKAIVGEHDFVARIGGDEFIILSPNSNENFVDDIKIKLSQKVIESQFEDFKFSISFGYSFKNSDSKSIDEVIKEAEDNMYSNKVLHGQSARNESVMTILQALKDKYSEERVHSDKVSYYCMRMGEELGYDKDNVKELELAGLMHDIGKITVPDGILYKPGKLTDEEWKVMKNHTINGYNILRSADKYSRLAEYALSHHERYDGKGYPNGLMGDEIPLFARIISIADSYEAMTADRPYRKSLGHEYAVEELRRCSGTQFDPELLAVFIDKVLPHLSS